MKRYILFQYDDYYPQGGTTDITGNFDTLEDTFAFIETSRYKYYDILDIVTGNIVSST